jgi:2Fe-2S iron-sulfur cluster binding domain
MPETFRINVNGAEHAVTAESDTRLLYVLRNDLGLNGPKFGCGLAQCGACTAIGDGEATRTCVFPLSAVGSASVVTLEGLGTIESLLGQIVSTPPYLGRFTREIVQAELNRFHYDTAQVSLAGTLAALGKLVPVSQIVYGSDFPYRTAAEQSEGIDATFGEQDHMRVHRENALRIFDLLRQFFVAFRNFEHHPPSFRIAKGFGQNQRLLTAFS